MVDVHSLQWAFTFVILAFGLSSGIAVALSSSDTLTQLEILEWTHDISKFNEDIQNDIEHKRFWASWGFLVGLGIMVGSLAWGFYIGKKIS